ncbi:hypothetical protein [Microbaculum marinisediminis]|uniref:Alpha-galactosidase NEW3 domain-containing protein n=1 Tax=Microbaculum marinisediminis TaxID=2931392 RepID=A0AAW5QS72_9HYPH|nr:hypothetical protein [Microbaculum sp. A6E488]MCT8970503.1 hypothetical protein [Microbaculum sp. A6E488]
MAAGVALPSIAAAQEGGLTLFVVTEPPMTSEPGPVSYSPGSRAVARLIFENRGEAPLEAIRVEVELAGAWPAVTGASTWTRDGNTVRATVGTLAPGGSIELPLVVELADGTERGARGTGGEARIRASVPASGETLVAEAEWPIASCADAYHAALRRIRYGTFAALRAAVDASREADTSLPGRTVFTFRPDGGREAASAVRFSERIAKARGLDSYYTTEDIRWISGRLINDIGVYLGQDRYPGLCTGVAEWTAILQDYIGRFTKRADEIGAYRASLQQAARAAVVTAGYGSLGVDGGIEPRNVAASLLSSIAPADAPPAGAAIFAAARDGVEAAGTTLTPERRDDLSRAFAALERLWYLDLAFDRAAAVADGFTGTLDAIREAHDTTCTCGS